MKIRRKQRQKRTHAVQWGLLIIVAALCFAGYWGTQGVLRVMEGWTEGLPSIDDTDFTNHTRESVVYAGDDSTLLAEFQLEKRDPVEIGQVSTYVLQGTVDTEDVRFYEHEGVDLTGIARALVNNLRGGDLEGASTITQQLVRNTILTQEATEISFERKIREAQLAVDMEKRYSKDEILLMYLNTINYGDGCYGIEAAAQNYFQVSAADLTLTQAATLVGIPQSPTYLNPKVYPEAALKRRNTVLDRMLSAGHITQEEHDAAQAEDLGLNLAPELPMDGIHAYPQFTSYVRGQLLAEDNPYGCSYADLFQGGLTIYTSLDVNLQQQAEEALAAQRARMAPELDSALVAIDPQTGLVKAMARGWAYGTNEEAGESQVNIATGGGGSGRQAGSTFKAFTLAAAIEKGIDPKTRIDCTGPLTINEGGATHTVNNFGGINYGIRTIESATAVSSNTGFVRLSQAIGYGSVADMASRLGVNSAMNPVPVLTLGAADVTPLDMASAYATLAAGGVKHDPVVITKILDRDGNVIYEAPDTSKRVLAEDVAGATTKVLRQVFEASDGTARGFGLANGQPVAGKTGTSENFADHWLVGYTPTLSCATWIGNPSGNIETPESLNCNALWQDFMNRATAGQAVQQFPETKAPAYNNEFNKKQEATLGSDALDKKKAEEEAKKKAEEDAKKESEDKGKDVNAAPSAVGKTLSEAAALLDGYKAGYVEEHSDTVPSGTVISQSVQDGQVVLVVSKGPKPAA